MLHGCCQTFISNTHCLQTLQGLRDLQILQRAIFLWGYLKSVVFRNPPPHNTEELKERIRHEIAEIPADMLRRVMGNIQLRLEECMQRNGSHLRDIVFRK